MSGLTIRAQLLLYFVLLVALQVGLSLFAIERLISIEAVVEVMNNRELHGTRLLADIDDEKSDFLLAAASRMVARDEASAKADDDADAAGRAIDRAGAEFLTLGFNENILGKFHTFRSAWQQVLVVHRTWIAVDKGGVANGFATFFPRLIALHKAAALTLNSVRSALALQAEREGQTAERRAEVALYVLIGTALLGLFLAGWIAYVVRVRISRPLSSITEALGALASGRRDVAVPETDRGDEIGVMAKAFDVFRQNVGALEKAHEAAEAAQQQAQALARHDPLTGLPNRRVFAEELEKALVQTRLGRVVYAVLLVDLDRFKPVNDVHGHSAGDRVLCQIADRLREVVRKGDTVARLGGDEFGVIIECDDTKESPTDLTIRLSDRILAAVKEPILVDNTKVEISSSIGIATCPADGADSEALLRAADIAMYRAKRDRRGVFRFFEAGMEVELRARAALEVEVRHAVATGEIQPHYQPLVALPDGNLIGFEILARWCHPTKGLLPPDLFVPVIEDLGLSSEFMQSLLRRACGDAKHWPIETMLALNVSPLQLRDALLPVQLLSILNETGFPARRLEIEITETALVTDLPVAKSILAALQSLGLKIALDDFGTGYSSLAHLREMRFDKIKIDRSFVQSMGTNVESAEIVAAILGLTKSLDLPTTAEGIEDAETLRLMIAGGCAYGQGHLFGKAMPAHEAAAFAKSQVEPNVPELAA